MKAVIIRSFDGIGTAEIEDVAVPVPGSGQVLIRTEAIEVNFPDILFFEGKYQNLPNLPFVPGLAAVGRVEDKASNVEGFSIGQRVLSLPGGGTYAQAFCADAQVCLPIPEGMPADDAAALGLVYQSAWFALVERGEFKPGSIVLVLGATGGIGMASVQIAKALGARTVIAVSRGPEACALAAEFGADHIIDGLDGRRPRELLGEEIPRLSGGHGVDIVIDPVGGELAIAAMRTLAWCGRIVIVGFASGAITQLPANYLLVKNASAVGLQWTDYQDRKPDQVADVQELLNQLYLRSALRPRISARFALDEFASALTILQRGQARGRVILIP